MASTRWRSYFSLAVRSALLRINTEHSPGSRPMFWQPYRDVRPRGCWPRVVAGRRYGSVLCKGDDLQVDGRPCSSYEHFPPPPVHVSRAGFETGPHDGPVTCEYVCLGVARFTSCGPCVRRGVVRHMHSGARFIHIWSRVTFFFCVSSLFRKPQYPTMGHAPHMNRFMSFESIDAK